MNDENVVLQFFQNNLWIAKIILVILLVFIWHALLLFVISIIKSKILFKRFSWKDKIDYIFLKPFDCIIYTLGFVYIIRILAVKFEFTPALNYVYRVEGALVVVIFTWMLLRTKKVIASYMAKSGALGHIDISTIEFVWKILTIVIVFISALIALNILGVDVMPLIAFGGVGAAAIGISAKDVLANFFGGLMIYLSRPFKIGDLVKIPKENIEGVIEGIGWYYTSIRNLEMTPMYVPNSIFSTAQIHNSSRCSNRRIEENIEIGSDSFGKLSSILQDIRDMIGKDKDIDNSQSNLVFFNAIGAYSLVIYIRIYTYKNSLEEYYEIKQRILSQIRDIIYGKGAEIPYPTNVVKIEKI